MSAPVVAFFGLKGGQGRTTLVHHLAWMFSDLGVPVVAADLDPQCELTQRFLGPKAAVELARTGQTVYGHFRRLLDGGDGRDGPRVAHPGGNIALLAGDVALYELEAVLEDAFRSSEAQVLVLRSLFAESATSSGARVVLVDLASGSGFINRAALAAADYLVVPVIPGEFAVMTLRFIGELLDRWRGEWRPLRGAEPLGYVVQMSPTPSSLAVVSAEFDRWIGGTSAAAANRGTSEGEHCLGIISFFSVLIATAIEVHRPVFHLTPADGAVGSMMRLVQRARADYEVVARAIAGRLGIQIES